MAEQEPRVLGDRYEIHQRLARGGMAQVYLARDRSLDRPVAVKELVPEFATDPSFVERFRREAQAAANLSHPNIVVVHDVGLTAQQHDDRPSHRQRGERFVGRVEQQYPAASPHRSAVGWRVDAVQGKRGSRRDQTCRGAMAADIRRVSLALRHSPSSGQSTMDRRQSHGNLVRVRWSIP